MKLFFNPISPHSQKVLVACYERDVSFEPAIVRAEDEEAREAFRWVSPLGLVPVLVDPRGETLLESTNIVDYLDTLAGRAPTLIPKDREAARISRYRDRLVDLYVTAPVLRLFDAFRESATERASQPIDLWREDVRTGLGLLEGELADGKPWLSGEDFGLADCAAGPAFFFCKRHIKLQDFPRLEAYDRKIAKRQSYARVRREAEPYFARLMKGLSPK